MIKIDDGVNWDSDGFRHHRDHPQSEPIGGPRQLANAPETGRIQAYVDDGTFCGDASAVGHEGGCADMNMA